MQRISADMIHVDGREEPTGTFTNLPAPALAPAMGKSTLEGCPTCKGLGVVRYDVPVGDPNFGQVEACPDCGPANEAARLRKLSRLTGDLATARLEHWRPMPGVDSVLPDVVAYLVKRGSGDDRKATGWITFSGPFGTGKTHLLASLVNHYAEAGVPAVYATMAEILQQLRDTYDEEAGVSFSNLWRDLTEARVVAIDEVEKFHGTTWAQEQVFAFLNHRHNNMNRTLTLLATNADCRRPDFSVLPPGPWAEGYIESRMRDGRGLILTDFWKAHDARPLMDEMEQARLEIL